MRIALLTGIRNPQGKHLIAEMPKSYDTSASNPNKTATGSLFVVDRRIIRRRLEHMSVAPGSAAAVSENSLPDLFGLYLWK